MTSQDIARHIAWNNKLHRRHQRRVLFLQITIVVAVSVAFCIPLMAMLAWILR